MRLTKRVAVSPTVNVKFDSPVESMNVLESFEGFVCLSFGIEEAGALRQTEKQGGCRETGKRAHYDVDTPGSDRDSTCGGRNGGGGGGRGGKRIHHEIDCNTMRVFNNVFNNHMTIINIPNMVQLMYTENSKGLW
jgi:hypothetical protein